MQERFSMNGKLTLSSSPQQEEMENKNKKVECDKIN